MVPFKLLNMDFRRLFNHPCPQALVTSLHAASTRALYDDAMQWCHDILVLFRKICPNKLWYE